MGIIGGHLPEIVIVLIVILIIWGPGKLPDIGAAMGKGIREFRKASSEHEDAAVGPTSSTTPTQPGLAQGSESVALPANGTNTPSLRS
jgi:sec-independent protein translocase protein TatA